MDDVTGWATLIGASMLFLGGVETAWKARPRRKGAEPRPGTFVFGLGIAVLEMLFLGGLAGEYFDIHAPRGFAFLFLGLGAVTAAAAFPARWETMRERWRKDAAGVEAYLWNTRWFGRAALIGAAAFAACLFIRFVVGWEPVWAFAVLALLPTVWFGQAWLVRLWDAHCVRPWQRNRASDTASVTEPAAHSL
jgi:hypothetical protein